PAGVPARRRSGETGGGISGSEHTPDYTDRSVSFKPCSSALHAPPWCHVVHLTGYVAQADPTQRRLLQPSSAQTDCRPPAVGRPHAAPSAGTLLRAERLPAAGDRPAAGIVGTPAARQ